MAAMTILPVRKALYEHLCADITLSSLVTGIYDRPAQGVVFPYITLGDVQCRDWSSRTTSGSEQLLALECWSREGGRSECLLIMERLHALLHAQPLAIEGQTLVSMYFVNAQLGLDGDGITYMGKMQFRLLLEMATS